MKKYIEVADFTEWENVEGYDDFVEEMARQIDADDRNVFTFETNNSFDDYFVAFQEMRDDWILFTDQSQVVALGNLRDVLRELYNIEGRFALKAKSTIGVKIVFEKE
jgi:hypothetical protein